LPEHDYEKREAEENVDEDLEWISIRGTEHSHKTNLGDERHQHSTNTFDGSDRSRIAKADERERRGDKIRHDPNNLGQGTTRWVIFGHLTISAEQFYYATVTFCPGYATVA
jgi:hypothetical protein